MRWQEEARRMTSPNATSGRCGSVPAACDAIFTARDAKRREADERKTEGRRAGSPAEDA
jgi:hypothetical protein